MRRAKLTAQRKGAYQKAHPETIQGGAPGKAGGGKAKVAKIASFAEDTAAKSGKSARSVRLDVTRAKALGPRSGPDRGHAYLFQSFRLM